MNNGSFLLLITALVSSCEQTRSTTITGHDFVRCMVALNNMSSIPPESKAWVLAGGCKDIFAEGACKRTLEKYSELAPENRVLLVKKNCYPVSEMPDGLDPGKQVLGARQRVLSMLTLEPMVVVVPEAKAHEPEPKTIKLVLKSTPDESLLILKNHDESKTIHLNDLAKMLAGQKINEAVIQADKDVRYTDLIRLMDTLKQVGIEKIALSMDQ